MSGGQSVCDSSTFVSRWTFTQRAQHKLGTVTESWLNDENESAIKIQDNDLITSNRLNKIGGGVAVIKRH